MDPEYHIDSFQERKETIFKWAVEVRGIENSQRIIGDNASKAIVELLPSYLHKTKRVEAGLWLNHSWFKSEKVLARLPEFPNKPSLILQMIRLEKICEKMSYGAPKPIDNAKEAIGLFNKLEAVLMEMLK